MWLLSLRVAEESPLKTIVSFSATSWKLHCHRVSRSLNGERELKRASPLSDRQADESCRIKYALSVISHLGTTVPSFCWKPSTAKQSGWGAWDARFPSQRRRSEERGVKKQEIEGKGKGKGFPRARNDVNKGDKFDRQRSLERRFVPTRVHGKRSGAQTRACVAWRTGEETERQRRKREAKDRIFEANSRIAYVPRTQMRITEQRATGRLSGTHTRMHTDGQFQHRVREPCTQERTVITLFYTTTMTAAHHVRRARRIQGFVREEGVPEHAKDTAFRTGNARANSSGGN